MDLTKAINEYLDRPEVNKLRRDKEKTEFIDAVVDFFSTEGIDRLAKNRRIDLIVLKSPYCKDTDYELFYDSRGLVKKVGGKISVIGPPSKETWHKEIPYDSEFQYHGNFKPDKERFVKDLECKVRCMVR